MTDTTDTDQLRAAAALLREAASHATPGPWRTHDTHLGAVGGHTATVLTDRPDLNDTELIAWLPTMSNAPWDDARNAWRNAGWMALMDPSVGLALADWLDTEAATWAGDEVHGSCSTTTCTLDAALAVARQVLGTTTGLSATAPAVELEDARATIDALRTERAELIRQRDRITHDTVAALAMPLTDAERQFLTFALDEAADEMANRDGFTAEDRAALDKFRRLAGPAVVDEQPETEGWVPKRVSLAAPCSACEHTLNWHRNNGGCSVHRCACDQFHEPKPAPAVDLTETADDDDARRSGRRLFAVERLCSGRPGYHTVTVKQLLTAMSDADEETEQPEPESCGRFVPDTPRAPGLCASCGDARGWHSRLAAEVQQPTPAPAEETKPARPVSPIDEVRAWNEAHPVGTPVRVWTGAREGDGTLTRTRSRASVLGTHTAVVWVDGEGSCISLSHVDPAP